MYRIFETKNLKELSLLSTSKGNQRKWVTSCDEYVKEQFFYQGKYWKDFAVEVIASTLGEQLGYNIVHQESVIIRDSCTGKYTYGVVSNNFCKSTEQFVSFDKLFSMNNYVFDYTMSPDKKFKDLVEKVHKFTGLDVTEYLIEIVLIDYLVGNEDRHLNNLGVKFNYVENSYTLAPIFDCGLGLFEHDDKYRAVRFSKCLEMMICKPFSADNQIITDWVLHEYKVKLPSHFSLTGCVIPSTKAGSYLRNRCMKLGIDLGGVE